MLPTEGAYREIDFIVGDNEEGNDVAEEGEDKDVEDCDAFLDTTCRKVWREKSNTIFELIKGGLVYINCGYIGTHDDT